MTLPTGQILNNRYRIVNRLGQGGFGAVYRAWDLNLQKPCAVKENLSSGAHAQEQFFTEAQILSQLTHPNLPRVTDYFEIPDQGVYLVMDYIEGETLAAKLQQNGPLPEAQVLKLAQEICAALDYLHGQTPPVIHRDIKPANLIIPTPGKATPQGEVILVDFGIAKMHTQQRHTATGAQGVTPGFSPPEQYMKMGTDARSDLYALGATLYALLTGTEPPDSLMRGAGTPLPPPRQRNPALTPRIEAVLLKALALRPDDRYQTAREMRAAFLNPVASPVSPPTSFKMPTWVWLLLGVVGVMFCGVLLAVAGNLGWQRTLAARASPTPFPTPETELAPPTLIILADTPAVTPLPFSANASPTLPPTFTSSPTLTSSPTITPTPTETPLPTPPPGWIAFHSDRDGSVNLYRIRSDGTGLQQLTFGSAQERVPAWSADGSHLAYQANEDGEFDIFILNVSTGAIQKITNNDCTDLAPSWSPDGTKLAFYSECDGNREIYTMNVDGSNRKQLTETGGDIYNWFPIWSHDGSRITFSSNRSGGKYQVYVMNADGSDLQAVARGCVSSFSPDDQWLVFTTYCSDSGDIWIIRPDGTDLRQLTTNDFNKNPSWGPNGQWIVFQLELSETDHDLYLMDINGENWFQLTSGSALDGSPVWGPEEIR